MSARREQTISSYFEEQVKTAPTNLAFVYSGRELSYADLNRRANRVAWWLREKGIGPESVVGVRMRRGVPLVTTILGIIKAGGAYLPLDLDDPPDRHAEMLSDACAVLTITDDANAAESSSRDRLAALCELPGDLSAYPAADPPALASADSLLYIVYTSGSTGRPKGIAMCHGPTVRLMQWSGQAHRRCSRTLHYYPITSDVGSYELMSTWLSGGSVVMASEDDRYDVSRIIELIGKHQIETVLLPFLALDQLARNYHGQTASLGSLREIVTTGDRLVVTPAIRSLCAEFDIELLENQWGSTEVNVVTAARMSQPAQDWPEIAAIGKPVAGAQVYALDESLAFSPVNVPGELHVGGDALSRGYVGRPDLTALAFVPDPFSSRPGSRMYRTGDLGRWQPNGELEFLGRTDVQLKVHGYRVEPGEIETALRAVPGIAEAIVVARDLGAGQPGLVTYFVPDGDAPSDATIRSELRKRLPSYMLPEHAVPLARMPMTATGKVDRALLPPPLAPTPAAARTEPLDETEQVIAAVWADALDVAAVGVDDNFFAVGGYSLLVNQVAYRLSEELGVEVPLRALFEAPTVAALAEWVRRELVT